MRKPGRKGKASVGLLLVGAYTCVSVAACVFLAAFITAIARGGNISDVGIEVNERPWPGLIAGIGAFALISVLSYLLMKKVFPRMSQNAPALFIVAHMLGAFFALLLITWIAGL